MENINILNKNINRAREIIKNTDITEERREYIIKKLLKLCKHYLKEIIFDAEYKGYEDLDEDDKNYIINIGKLINSTKKYLSNTTIGPKYKARQFLKTADYILKFINNNIVF